MVASANQNVAEIIRDACVAANIEMIDGLPAMPVSGDVGDVGHFCSPKLEQLGFLAHVAPAARGTVLSLLMRGVMQAGQNGLKSWEKKNKDASVGDHGAAAQAAFASVLDGTVSDDDDDEDGDGKKRGTRRVTLAGEARKNFVAVKCHAYAVKKGLSTSDASLEEIRADIETNQSAAYKKAIDAEIANIATARTYKIARKGKATAKASVDTGDFEF